MFPKGFFGPAYFAPGYFAPTVTPPAAGTVLFWPGVQIVRKKRRKGWRDDELWLLGVFDE